MPPVQAPQTGTNLEAMWRAGLTETQIQHLMSLRQDVREGRRSELTPEHKRRLFARHLYQCGLLRED